ncbi:DivIVA domain-containing protein [Paenibacillus marinisediminis]
MSQYNNLSDLGIRLSAIDIHQKEFKTAFRGYDPDQINEYLDEIIKDYQTFEDIIQKYELEIQQLKKKAVEQRSVERAPISPFDLPLERSAMVEKPIERIPDLPFDRPSERPSHRMELIDRVRELEKFCFGKARD